MKHICTLSDKNFLAKGLALYKSLKEHSSEEFTLSYLTLDQESYDTLTGLEFLDIIPISLEDLENENPELKTAKENRPYNEYCWTLASYFSHYLLTTKDLDHICYIDSDIYFYQDPDIIYKEIGEKSVGIIRHRHNSEGNRDGAYNVGVIYFKGDEKGTETLHWWMDAVLNKKHPHLATCGDQKYLEDFIPRFGSENVCIADNTFGHGAPWNYRLYNWDYIDDGDIMWENRRQPFVFNHFSRMSYDIKTGKVVPTSGHYADHTLGFQIFRKPEVNQLYERYFNILKRIHETLLAKKPEAPHIKKPELKIALGMIVFEGDYVLKQTLESIYPFVSQIMISEGPVKYWQDQGRTTSTDDTNSIIESLDDPLNKIKVVHGQFNEKDDQCKAYMEFLNKDADYIWNLDSDEMFKQEDVIKLMKLLHDNAYTSVGVKPYSFYGGFDRYITGFEEEKDQFLRIFKVFPGSTWKTHRPPTIQHYGSVRVTDKHLDSETLANEHDIRMYHYSYVFPKQVHDKIAYYKRAVSKNKCIDNYFENVYLPWVNGDEFDRDMIEDAYDGVHEWKSEFRRPTRTAAFEGTHPNILVRDRDEFSKKFNDQLKEFTNE